MSKRSDILQKKLQELESEVIGVIHLPPETPSRHLISEGIEQRFVFLKNLLSAEISSQPANSHRLHHIAERLTGLEAAFRNWDEFRSISTLTDNNFDTCSVCSECTRVALNGDAETGHESDLSTDGLQVEYYEADTGEMVQPEKKVEKEESVKKKEGKIFVIGKYFGMLGCGMILGAICMGSFMVKYDFIDPNFGFIPPT